jgi:hypothetical protein
LLTRRPHKAKRKELKKMILKTDLVSAAGGPNVAIIVAATPGAPASAQTTIVQKSI